MRITLDFSYADYGRIKSKTTLFPSKRARFEEKVSLKGL